MSEENVFTFDEIVVFLSNNEKQPSKRVLPPTLAYDRKSIYAGNSNWHLPLKDLNALDKQVTEREEFGRSNMRTETLVLSLRSSKLSFICTHYKTRNMTAKKFAQLEQFLEGLKNAHRQARIKHVGKDPYEEKGKTNNNSRSVTNTQKRSKTSEITARVPTVTPARTSHSVYLTSSPSKKVYGRYASPLRKTIGDFSLDKEPSISSPLQTLILPNKSPRNATPTKLRNIDDHEEDLRGFQSSPFSQRPLGLISMSGGDRGRLKGKSKLQKRLMRRLMDFSEDDEDAQRKGNQLQENGSDIIPNLSEDKSLSERSHDEVDAEETSVYPKRKRLLKGHDSFKKPEENDSDFEFENEYTESFACVKKRLRLSVDDEDEGSEDGHVHLTSQEAKDQAELKKTDEDDKKEGSLSSSVSMATREDVSKTNENSKSSLPASIQTSNPVVKKSSTIHSFFTNRGPSKSKLTTSSDPNRNETDTYGGTILSSPCKKTPNNANDFINDSSITPPPNSMAKPTQVLKQMQTSYPSGFFSSSRSHVWDSVSRSTSQSATRGQVPYTKEDENADTDYEHMATSDEGNFATRTFPLHTKTVRPPRAYGRNNRSFTVDHSPHTIPKPLRLSTLGQSRLGRRKTFDVSSPAKRLDFDFEESIVEKRNNCSSNQLLETCKKTEPPSKADSELIVNPPKHKQLQFASIIPGIQNLGNTCYLSASLQTLFGIPRLFYDLYNAYTLESPKKKMPLTKALLEIATAVGVLPEDEAPTISPECARNNFQITKAINPSALKKQMDIITDKFAGYEQRDAHEFLSDLVDFLHSELAVNTTVGPNELESTLKTNSTIMGSVSFKIDHFPSNKHATLTDNYFQLNVRVFLECDSCKYSRFKEEMYRHLSLDVGEDLESDPWTVERGLKQFFQPGKRDLKCEKCKYGMTATQTIEIITCPKVLLLHFKRFIVTQEVKDSKHNSENKENISGPTFKMEMVLKKNKAKIKLEESLTMKAFFAKDVANLDGVYGLCSVVHHVGNTAFSGHYTACSKKILSSDTDHSCEHWFLFDDKVGTKTDFDYVTSNERNQRNCYMALYELKENAQRFILGGKS